MKKLTFTLFTVLLTITIFAQDYHYTQQYAVPTLLNPSMTGYTNCLGKLALQYRNQWSTRAEGFQTMSAAYEHTVFKNDRNINGFGGIGISLMNDMTGGSLLRQTSVAVSAAYHFYLDGSHHFLSIGTQVGAGQFAARGALSYDSQFDGLGFDLALPSGEQVMRPVTYLDVAAGLSYSYTSEQLNVNVGGAIFHLPEPNVSLIEGAIHNLPRRFALHTNLEYKATDQLALLGRVVYQKQDHFSLLNIGGFVKMNLSAWQEFTFVNDNTFLYAGVLYRWNDAIAAMMKLQLKKVGIGLSYDFSSTDLVGVSKAHGGFEVALTYEFGDCDNFEQTTPLF